MGLAFLSFFCVAGVQAADSISITTPTEGQAFTTRNIHIQISEPTTPGPLGPHVYWIGTIDGGSSEPYGEYQVDICVGRNGQHQFIATLYDSGGARASDVVNFSTSADIGEICRPSFVSIVYPTGPGPPIWNLTTTAPPAFWPSPFEPATWVAMGIGLVPGILLARFVIFRPKNAPTLNPDALGKKR